MSQVPTPQRPARDGFRLAPAGHLASQSVLVQRFGVPPFSVLDARAGYWQARKAMWIKCGIQSELGRANSPTSCGTEKYQRGRRRLFEDTAGRSDESGRKIANVDRAKGRVHPRSSDLADGAVNSPTECPTADGDPIGISLFDPVLCELAYSWFAPPAAAILDPFAGGSVRGVVAAMLGHHYTGVDLSERQIVANRGQAAEIVPHNPPRWVVGDSMQIGRLVPGAYDLVFSCPPYADLERYSDDPRDLSTFSYDRFVESLFAIVRRSVGMLKPDRFAVFVVGDVRDERGFYRGFPMHTVQAFEEAGARLYNWAILIQAVGSLPVRVGKMFTGARKLGKGHQDVIVAYKGDPKNIRRNFPALDFGDNEEWGAEETGAQT